MSSSTTVPDVLNLTAEDAALMLSAGVHLGGKNVNVDMENYVYKKRSDGELKDGLGGGRRRVGYGTAKTIGRVWHGIVGTRSISVHQAEKGWTSEAYSIWK